jgi:hypothetical protein
MEMWVELGILIQLFSTLRAVTFTFGDLNNKAYSSSNLEISCLNFISIKLSEPLFILWKRSERI